MQRFASLVITARNMNKRFPVSQVIHNLLTLSTSHYSHVRAKAQDSLLRCLSHFSHSYLEILPRLEQLLKEDNDIKHEEFKGALYVILGKTVLVTKRALHV